MKLIPVTFISPGGKEVQLHEPDDHILELRYDDHVIARFSQTGVTIDNILKEIKSIDNRN